MLFRTTGERNRLGLFCNPSYKETIQRGLFRDLTATPSQSKIRTQYNRSRTITQQKYVTQIRSLKITNGKHFFNKKQLVYTSVTLHESLFGT